VKSTSPDVSTDSSSADSAATDSLPQVDSAAARSTSASGSHRVRRSIPRPSRRHTLLVVFVVACCLATVATLRATSAVGRVLWEPRFADSDQPVLVTNEVAYRKPGAAGAHTSPAWLVTSGSLFAVKGTGYTGPVDRGRPGLDSQSNTGSAVFRATSTRSDLGDVRVDLALHVDGIVGAAVGKQLNYDGVHLMVRYTSPDSVYTVSLCRRDGTSAIKKKSPGIKSDEPGEPYITLAQVPFACPLNAWATLQVDVRNVAGGVSLTLRSDGHQVVSVIDVGQGGVPALTAPGRVGLRGDDTEFHFRDLSVSELRR
jgi:hypothetical protein